MSKETVQTFLGQLPTWALVVLAMYGLIALKQLHDQISKDHETTVLNTQEIIEAQQLSAQNAVAIAELKAIAIRLTVLVEQRN